jgi:hypothetical protein
LQYGERVKSMFVIYQVLTAASMKFKFFWDDRPDYGESTRLWNVGQLQLVAGAQTRVYTKFDIKQLQNRQGTYYGSIPFQESLNV